MKQIIETRIVEQEQTTIHYFADDGKEFDTEKKCKQYELEQNIAFFEKRFNSIKHIAIDIPLIEWCDTTACAYAVKMDDESDYEAVVNYYKVTGNSWTDVEISKPDVFPTTMVIVENEGYVGDYHGGLDGIIKGLNNAMAQIALFKV